MTLASQTPHRALRELYDAFIVYGRAYADALPSYQPGDDSLARTSLAALDAITTICAANRSITAMPQVPAVGPVRPPTTPPAAVDSANTQRFLPPGNPTCARWASDAAALQEQAADWLALDPNIGVAQWTPSQRAVSDNAARVFTSHADDMEASGRASGNAVVEDFATLGALYFRAFVVEQPLYWTGDHDLADVGFTLNDVVASACQVS